jgi:hypothetical protein
MQSLALRTLLQTPRAQIAENQGLIQPIILYTMNGALADVDPMDAFDALVAFYNTPAVYNRFEVMTVITIPCLIPNFYSFEHIVEMLDIGIGLFSTQSGRDMLCEMVRESTTVPLRNTNPQYYNTNVLRNPLFLDTMNRLDNLARNNFAYDAVHKRVSV